MVHRVLLLVVILNLGPQFLFIENIIILHLTYNYTYKNLSAKFDLGTTSGFPHLSEFENNPGA